MVFAHLKITLAELVAYFVGNCGNGKRGQVERVGTHIGYETGLVETLGHHHGLRYGEPEFTGCFLLQGGGGEWRGGGFAEGTHVYVSHLKPRAGAVIEKSLGLFLGGEALGKLCAQLSAVVGGEQACDAEIRLAFECLDFVFALHGETHCYRLHAARGQRRLYLAPEHGRELETHNAVEHTACLLGVDQIEVDSAGIGNGVEYGVFCNLVKYYSACIFRFESENFVKVPGNGFSLAVLIGSQPHHGCLRGSLA